MEGTSSLRTRLACDIHSKRNIPLPRGLGHGVMDAPVPVWYLRPRLERLMQRSRNVSFLLRPLLLFLLLYLLGEGPVNDICHLCRIIRRRGCVKTCTGRVFPVLVLTLVGS